MNRVRAGVVEHPTQWEFCGYNEIQNPRKRKGIIDFSICYCGPTPGPSGPCTGMRNYIMGIFYSIGFVHRND